MGPRWASIAPHSISAPDAATIAESHRLVAHSCRGVAIRLLTQATRLRDPTLRANNDETLTAAIITEPGGKEKSS